MAVYLIDYENVYIEGLDGLESLTENDMVCIFYTHNRCGLTFDLHKRLIVAKPEIKLFEVASAPPKNPYSRQSVNNSIKNALDLQLTLYAGYLAAKLPEGQNNIFIISKDKDFGLDVTFSGQYLEGCNTVIERYSTINNALAGSDDEILQDNDEEPISEGCEETDDTTAENAAETEGAESENIYTEESIDESEEDSKTESEAVENFSPTLFNAVYNLLDTRYESPDDNFVREVCAMIADSDDLLSLNNNLAAYFRDGEKVKEIYHVLKPQFELLKKF